METMYKIILGKATTNGDKYIIQNQTTGQCNWVGSSAKLHKVFNKDGTLLPWGLDNYLSRFPKQEQRDALVKQFTDQEPKTANEIRMMVLIGEIELRN